ncbi:unnamed protein product, partial [Symbiodinium microadriaticum]
NVQFTDIDTDEYLIEGVIRWDPPADEASVLHYAVWVSHDKESENLGAIQFLAKKVPYNSSSDPVEYHIPVGTNQVTLENTARDLQFGYYGVWLVVLANRAGVPMATTFAEAGYVAIYDSSNHELGDVRVASVAFTDEDYLENYIGGTVSWERDPVQDYGFVSEFQVYLAEDASGTNQRLLGSVVATLETYLIANGTAATERYILVYAANPNGPATAAESTLFSDWIWTPPFTITSTTTTTLTKSATTTASTITVTMTHTSVSSSTSSTSSTTKSVTSTSRTSSSTSTTNSISTSATISSSSPTSSSTSTSSTSSSSSTSTTTSSTSSTST